MTLHVFLWTSVVLNVLSGFFNMCKGMSYRASADQKMSSAIAVGLCLVMGIWAGDLLRSGL